MMEKEEYTEKLAEYKHPDDFVQISVPAPVHSTGVYNRQAHPAIVKGLVLQGLKNYDIASVLGIELETLREWRTEYTEFDAAFMLALEDVDAAAQNALIISAVGSGKTFEEQKTTIVGADGEEGDTITKIITKSTAPSVSALKLLFERTDKMKAEQKQTTETVIVVEPDVDQ